MIKRLNGAPGAVPPRAAIPAHEERAVPQPPAQAPQPAPAQRTCLLVDDSRMIRKVSRRIVESVGYAVIEAPNLAAAEKIGAEFVQLHIDNHMPDITVEIRQIDGGYNF